MTNFHKLKKDFILFTRWYNSFFYITAIINCGRPLRRFQSPGEEETNEIIVAATSLFSGKDLGCMKKLTLLPGKILSLTILTTSGITRSFRENKVASPTKKETSKENLLRIFKQLALLKTGELLSLEGPRNNRSVNNFLFIVLFCKNWINCFCYSTKNKHI